MQNVNKSTASSELCACCMLLGLLNMVYWLEIGTCLVDILFINFYVTKSAPDVNNIF